MANDEETTQHFDPSLFTSDPTSMQPFTPAQLATLYTNHELSSAEGHLASFVASQKDLERHPLHELLRNYRQARRHAVAARQKVNDALSASHHHRDRVWHVEGHVETEEGECEDGNVVSAEHKYETATFDAEGGAATLQMHVRTAKRALVDELAPAKFRTRIRRMQVEECVVKAIQGDVRTSIIYSNSSFLNLS